MRVLQSSIFRALVAIAVGCLLIKYPDNTVTGITIAIGVLFLLSGIVACLTYVNARRHQSEYKIYDAEGRLVAGGAPTFPIVGVGSVVLGLILALAPNQFVALLMYVIGAILIMGAANQMLNLIAVRRYGHPSLWFWVLPSLTLLAGLYIIIKPLAPASVAMWALGWLTLFYGMTEVINAWKIFVCKRQWQKVQAEMDADTVSNDPTKMVTAPEETATNDATEA